MVDRVGQQLGNYHLVRHIGEGGFADVYLGEHIHLGTQAAIKVLQMRLLEKKNIDAFHNEARTIAHLIHPHIIRVLDYGVQDWVPFLVMDYAPGGTLRQRFTGKPAQISRLFPYITQMAAALQYAHDRHLIHRDVKPENMLLGSNGDILLSDFGFAMVVENINSRGTRDMSGTAVYMAPEQLKGRPCAASDQYSLGVVIYEWMTGIRPFHGSFFEVASQQMLMPIQPLREKVPDVAPEIEAVVMRALATEPEMRFGSVKEFAQSLLLAYQASRRAPNTANYPGVSQPGWLPPTTSGVFPKPPLDGGNPFINSQPGGFHNPQFRKSFDRTSTGNMPSMPPQSIPSSGPASLNGLPDPASQSFKMPRGTIRPSSASLPALPHLKGDPDPRVPPGGQVPMSGSSPLSSQSMRRPTTQTSLPGMPGQNSLHGMPSQNSLHNSMSGQNSMHGMAGQNSLHGFSAPGSQMSRATGASLPGVGRDRPFPQVTPSSGSIPSMPSTQGRMRSFSSDRPTGNIPAMPTGSYPAARRPLSSSSLIRNISTPSPMPVPSANQSLQSGAFSAPAEPAASEEEELKQLYAELDEINKASVGTKPLPDKRRRATDKTLFWLISIFVVVLVVGSSTGIFYLVNMNQAKNTPIQATATSTGQMSNGAQVQTTATEPAIPTITPNPSTPTAIASTANPYPPNNGVLVVNDPLSVNNYKWQEYTDTTNGNSCRFTGGAYRATSVGNSLSAATCFAQATDFTNFTYQVQMSILQAGTQFSGGGIVFRGNSQSNVYYYFEIYKSGRYNFTACFGPGKANCTVQLSGYPKQSFSVPGFNMTAGQSNTLAVVARDTAFTIYVNGQHALGPIYDGNFTHGMVGVYATGGVDSGPSQTAEVVFSNVKIWRQ